MDFLDSLLPDVGGSVVDVIDPGETSRGKRSLLAEAKRKPRRARGGDVRLAQLSRSLKTQQERKARRQLISDCISHL